MNLKLKAELGKKAFNFSHKKTAIITGTLAQMLIIDAVIISKTHLAQSIIMVLQAFFILLPIAYYNMRAHETEGQREWI